MRQVQVTITLDVADNVTDEQILGWIPTVAAQVEEPVSGYDEAGNEQRFVGANVTLDVSVDAQNLTTTGADARSITWTEVTEPIDSDGSLVTDIGRVSGIGDEYLLYVKSTQVPNTTPPEWTHEFFTLIFPPSPMFGTNPKRSQTFTSNVELLRAVGADIDRDLAVERS